MIIKNFFHSSVVSLHLAWELVEMNKFQANLRKSLLVLQVFVRQKGVVEQLVIHLSWRPHSRQRDPFVNRLQPLDVSFVGLHWVCEDKVTPFFKNSSTFLHQIIWSSTMKKCIL